MPKRYKTIAKLPVAGSWEVNMISSRVKIALEEINAFLPDYKISTIRGISKLYLSVELAVDDDLGESMLLMILNGALENIYDSIRQR